MSSATGYPVRVVIAPDKFKGSLPAAGVAEALRQGLVSSRPEADISCVPVADGGEGTVDAALGSGFRPVDVTVSGPLGDPVQARFAIDGRRAVIEMAAASGLGALPIGDNGVPRRDALRASSAGTGELIRTALDAGCTEIVLGVGGSANTDGGAGLLTALGARLLTETGEPVSAGGAGLVDLASIELADLDPRIAATSFVLASDVDNPLLGAAGAAAVFAPQKGASADDVAVLERGLGRLVEVLGRLAAAPADTPGAGAAGGVGYAALAVLGATRHPGVEVVLDLVRLADRLAGVDVVITGEGSLDVQSLGGKTPIGVTRMARRHGVEVVLAVCGRSLLSSAQAREAGLDRVFALLEYEPDPARSMREAATLLRTVGADIGATLR